MSTHSILSPSSAYRWSRCTASKLLEMQYADELKDDIGNIHSNTGTIAHLLAETALRFDARCEDILADMAENIQGYVDYVKDLKGKYGWMKLEQKVEYYEGYFGTADAIIFDRGELHVVDLKYGRGVVKAEGNLQMLIYAYGVLRNRDDVDSVTMHIYAPRGKTSSWTVTPQYIRDAFNMVVKPAIEKIERGEMEFFNEPDVCRWCPVWGICPEKKVEKDEEAQRIIDEFDF